MRFVRGLVSIVIHLHGIFVHQLNTEGDALSTDSWKYSLSCPLGSRYFGCRLIRILVEHVASKICSRKLFLLPVNGKQAVGLYRTLSFFAFAKAPDEDSMGKHPIVSHMLAIRVPSCDNIIGPPVTKNNFDHDRTGFINGHNISDR